MTSGPFVFYVHWKKILSLPAMAQISMSQISTNEPDGVSALVFSCVEEGAGVGNFQVAAIII